MQCCFFRVFILSCLQKLTKKLLSWFLVCLFVCLLICLLICLLVCLPVCLCRTEEICLDHAMGQLCNYDLKPDETVDVQTKLGGAEGHD